MELVLAGVGPGTFTGIRIAAATARALSAGTGIPLSKNSTLDALAAPALSCSRDVLAVLDARRGQVFARRFSEAGPTTGIYCVRPEELSVEGEPLLVGDGAVRYRDELSGLGRIPPDGLPAPQGHGGRARYLCRPRPRRPEELVPIYVREPDAEVQARSQPLEPPLSEAGPHLRRMEARDLPSVMEIDALCLPRPWSAAIWRGELESPFGLYLVLEERGEVFGHIGVRHVLGELHITTIAVQARVPPPGTRPRPDRRRARRLSQRQPRPPRGTPDQRGGHRALRVARLHGDGPQAPLLRRRGRVAHDPEPRRDSSLERLRSSRSLRASSLRRRSSSGGSKGFSSNSAGARQARKETKMPPAIRGLGRTPDHVDQKHRQHHQRYEGEKERERPHSDPSISARSGS